MNKYFIKIMTTTCLLFLFTGMMQLSANDNSVVQQGFTVTGTVTDAQGPMPGVNVVIKGTNFGQITDANGKYSINVPNANAVLQFSFVGYETTEFVVGDQRVIDVLLSEGSQALEEVVVLGYSTQRKSDVTGSVVSVKGTELTHMPTMRSDQALQGRAAGVMIQQTDGAPGGNVNITIRGTNSISGGNKVLVVVDGLQGADITLVNPNDIESIEVLKDASATAIFGSRGANGVILITTKRGNIGKPTFDYNYSLGIQKVRKKFDLMNPAEFAETGNAYRFSQDRRSNGNKIPNPPVPYTAAQIQDFKNGIHGTDWQDEIFRTALLHNHQLSMRGGTENFKYFVSGGYMKQEGVIIASHLERYNLRANFDANFTPWFDAGLQVNMVKQEGNVHPQGEGSSNAFGGSMFDQVMNVALMFDPCNDIYDKNGDYILTPNSHTAGITSYANPDMWNPLVTALNQEYIKKLHQQDAKVNFDFKILKGLTLRIEGGASIANTNLRVYQGRLSFTGYSAGGMGKQEFGLSQYYQNSNQLSYQNTIGNHRISAFAVAEQSVTMDEGLYSNEAMGFFDDGIGSKNLGIASIYSKPTNSASKNALKSYLGSAEYTFKDRYMIKASFRADGSSKFAKNNKWGYFPSAAIGWNVGEEEFLRNVMVISQLKIRGSWGQTGNQAIRDYQTLSRAQSGYDYPYWGTGIPNVGVRIAGVKNPDLKWETTVQTNLGIDMGFYRQKLTVSVDLYKKTTKDLLMNVTLPGYTAMGSVTRNVGSIENKGLEIQIGATPYATKDFVWTTTANVSLNRSKVLELTQPVVWVIPSIGTGYSLGSAGTFGLKQLRVGQPVEQFYGFDFLGIWKTEEEQDALKTYGQVAGEQKFREVPNKNGEMEGRITTAKDANEPIGLPTPKFFYGWSNNITYKNWDLSFLIQGSYGNKVFNAVRLKTDWPHRGGTSRILMDRWTPENQTQHTPGFLSAYETAEKKRGYPTGRVPAATSTYVSSRFLEDGSYIRLKNITLMYTVPQKFISRFAIYFTGTNLITLTKYTGFDPEVSSFNRNVGGLGVDISNYPTAKMFTFGVNLTF